MKSFIPLSRFFFKVIVCLTLLTACSPPSQTSQQIYEQASFPQKVAFIRQLANVPDSYSLARVIVKPDTQHTDVDFDYTYQFVSHDLQYTLLLAYLESDVEHTIRILGREPIDEATSNDIFDGYPPMPNVQVMDARMEHVAISARDVYRQYTQVLPDQKQIRMMILTFVDLHLDYFDGSALWGVIYEHEDVNGEAGRILIDATSGAQIPIPTPSP